MYKQISHANSPRLIQQLNSGLDGRICTSIQKRKPLNIFILKWEFSLHNFRSCIIYAA